jgi:iron complex transport system substrate-binding protein
MPCREERPNKQGRLISRMVDRASGKQLIAVLVLSVLLLCPALSFAQPAIAAEGKGITVTDFRGKQLNIRETPKRIVCLIESALTGIYMLGKEGSVVGIPRDIYQTGVFPYYASMDERIKARNLPAPGNWDFVNVESVLSLKPDLVIMWAHQSESISALEERGIPVFGVFLSRVEDVYREMEALGKLTGSEKRASTLIKYTKEEIGKVGKRLDAVSMNKRPAVYYMWAKGTLETSCAPSTVDDLIGLAGGRNACPSAGKEHAVINLETLLSWNPDMILMWYNEKKDPADILRDPQLKSLKAVKNRRVHELPEGFLSDLWTLKFQYAVKVAAKWAHPQLYEDMDLAVERPRMLKNLYGARKW